MANNYKPLFVFSHPRVASNLFMHLLANDPQIAQLTYLFFESFYSGPDSISQHRSTKVASTTKEQNAHPSYQEAFDAVTDFINVAQTQNKTPLLKEHLYYMIKPSVTAQHIEGYASRPLPVVRDNNPDDLNPTVLPVAFLEAVSPTIMIRHPARFIPSFYRAMLRSVNPDLRHEPIEETQWPIDFSLKWLRLLYDYYTNHSSQTPLIIDGDDLVNHPQAIMDVFCEKNGLDKTKVQYEWEPIPLKTETPLDRLVTAFKGTLHSSKGINREAGPLKAPNLQEEVELWKEEFGDDLARKFKQYAEATMDDYMSLYKLRLKVADEQ